MFATNFWLLVRVWRTWSHTTWAYGFSLKNTENAVWPYRLDLRWPSFKMPLWNRVTWTALRWPLWSSQTIRQKMTTVLTNQFEDTVSIARLKSTFFDTEDTAGATLLIAMPIIKKHASPTPYHQNKTVPSTSGHVSFPNHSASFFSLLSLGPDGELRSAPGLRKGTTCRRYRTNK